MPSSFFNAGRTSRVGILFFAFAVLAAAAVDIEPRGVADAGSRSGSPFSTRSGPDGGAGARQRFAWPCVAAPAGGIVDLGQNHGVDGRLERPARFMRGRDSPGLSGTGSTPRRRPIWSCVSSRTGHSTPSWPRTGSSTASSSRSRVTRPTTTALRPSATALIAATSCWSGNPRSPRPGRFRLLTLVPQPAEQPPGQPLQSGVRSTVERFLDSEDIWNVDLQAGVTYRLRFQSNGDRAVMVSPATDKVVDSLYGSGYHLFTPGPSGGGRYLIYVTAGYRDGPHRYTYRVESAGLDDTGPGRLLHAGTWLAGQLDPRGIDVDDIYHFELSTRSDILLALARPRSKGVQLLLMRDDGKDIAQGQALRRMLPAGSYAVSVFASPASPAVRYRLALRVHEVSRLFVSSKTVVDGTPVTIVTSVGRPPGRYVTLEIDRLDPVQGWVYARAYELPVLLGRTASLTWLPSQVGRYRARITRPSRSGYVFVHVLDAYPAGPMQPRH